MSQKGLAPILIIVLITLALGGVLVYQNQTKSPSVPSQPVPTTEPTSTPQTTSIPSSTSSPAITKKSSTPKPTTTPSPSPSLSPSPSESSSPTPKPSPVPGVYNIEQGPYKDITIDSNTRGYGISALLKDSNGAYIQDLSDYSFSWSIENPSIADLRVNSGGYDSSDCFSYAPYNIKAPCPPLRAELGPKSSGSTTVKVKITKKSENKVIGEATYNVTNK